MTETELIKSLLSASTAKDFKQLDVYIARNPKQITKNVRDVLESYTMARIVVLNNSKVT